MHHAAACCQVSAGHVRKLLPRDVAPVAVVSNCVIGAWRKLHTDSQSAISELIFPIDLTLSSKIVMAWPGSTDPWSKGQ